MREWQLRCKAFAFPHFPPTSHFSAIHALAAVAILWLCAGDVLAMKITGPNAAYPNSAVTFTWTTDSSDPAQFEIDIDTALNSLLQSDSYFIANNLNSAPGSATINIPVLTFGTHRIAFSSTDGFNILDEGSIEIIDPSSPLPSPISPSTSISSTITTTPVVSKTPPPPPPPPTHSSTPTVPPPNPATTAASKSRLEPSSSLFSSSSSSSAVPSPTASFSTNTTSSVLLVSAPTASESPSIVPQNALAKHNNVGAIVGATVGGIVVVLLALLGFCYILRRKRAAASKASDEIAARPQFLVSSVTTSPVYTVSTESRAPWESHPPPSSTSASSASPSPVVSGSQKQPFNERDAGQSREALLEEVQRLRDQIGAISPPEYPGE
ncbi:hypothetical protein R3P38DRAFT_3389127 [Favolaschia claudopus]|uniref:Uncharacterized protein n=1 Tax=Favolaschia claudopus TaxID=2862362 RepID=A0AAW0D0I3_9AGAR